MEAKKWARVQVDKKRKVLPPSYNAMSKHERLPQEVEEWLETRRAAELLDFNADKELHQLSVIRTLVQGEKDNKRLWREWEDYGRENPSQPCQPQSSCMASCGRSDNRGR